MKKTLSIFAGIIICFGLFTGCGGKSFTVDAKSLSDIQVMGFNNRGKLEISNDKESESVVRGAYREKNKKSIDAESGLVFSRALDSISFKADKTDNLSNGDEIKIKALYDETLIKNAKIKIENEEFTYTVSGLEEATLIDPFEEIELVYQGAAPEARVEVYNRSEKQFIREIKYKAEPSSNLRVGDKVVVTAELDVSVFENGGFIVPDDLTKEYTVENIDEYVKDFNDIDQSAREKMSKEAIDRVESYAIDSSGDIVKALGLGDYYFEGTKVKHEIDRATLDKPELTNIYFNTLKQGASGADSKNDIFYVFKITAYHHTETEPRIAYAAVRFQDAIKKVDGSTDVDTAYESSMFKNNSIFSADKDFNIVYREIVTTQKTWYEIQEITP